MAFPEQPNVIAKNIVRHIWTIPNTFEKCVENVYKYKQIDNVYYVLHSGYFEDYANFWKLLLTINRPRKELYFLRIIRHDKTNFTIGEGDLAHYKGDTFFPCYQIKEINAFLVNRLKQKFEIRLESNEKIAKDFKRVSFSLSGELLKEFFTNDRNYVSIQLELEVSYKDAELNIINSSPRSKIFNSSHKFINDFQSVLGDESSSDVTITTKDAKFPAHKIILSARSPTFKAIFSDHKTNKEIININTDLSGKVFGELLRFIYSNTVEDWETVAVDLLAAAIKYQILNLEIKCEKYLINSVNTDNAIQLFIVASQNNLKELQQSAMKTIVYYLDDFLNKEEWNALPSDSITEILKFATEDQRVGK